MTATAIQIPGWCAAPTFFWFLQSFRAAMEDNTLNSSGARDSSSSTNADHLKSTISESGIFLKSELFGDLWHRLLHSLLMLSKTDRILPRVHHPLSSPLSLLMEHVHQVTVLLPYLRHFPMPLYMEYELVWLLWPTECPCTCVILCFNYISTKIFVTYSYTFSWWRIVFC